MIAIEPEGLLMSTQHTPGPWSVDAMGNVWSADTKVCEMSEHPVIMSGCYREKTDDEHRANARLIAAAPEMLEALKMSLKIGDGCSRGFLNEVQKQARAAIAKATGESK